MIEHWLGFWKSTCVPMQTAATHPAPSGTSKVGMLRRTIDTGESVEDSWPRQKTGLAARGALKLRRTPGLTMMCPNACTRRWDTRWWTAVCITARRCDNPQRPAHHRVRPDGGAGSGDDPVSSRPAFPVRTPGATGPAHRQTREYND